MTTSLFWYQLLCVHNELDSTFQNLNSITVNTAFYLMQKYTKTWQTGRY
jgi:hypothetical protein